jgi:DNA polymerase-1
VLLLVDANNLFMRAHYATARENLTASGESTAALTVFSNSLTRYLRQYPPERLAVCWDGGGSAYRMRLLDQYKANRHPEARHHTSRTARDQVREFMATANLHQMMLPGFEADDLISRYWFDAEEEVLIISNDKDFFQLAGPNPQGFECKILRISGGGAPDEVWDAERVEKATGVPPQHIPSWMAITGDEGDNVPGVSGIGPKRARAALREARWVLGAVEDPSVRRAHSQVVLNRLLVNLRLPVPELLLGRAPAFSPTGPNSVLYPDFVRFLQAYQLNRLLAQLYSGKLWPQPV